MDPVGNTNLPNQHRWSSDPHQALTIHLITQLMLWYFLHVHVRWPIEIILTFHIFKLNLVFIYHKYYDIKD